MSDEAWTSLVSSVIAGVTKDPARRDYLLYEIMSSLRYELAMSLHYAGDDESARKLLTDELKELTGEKE
jgi:hypothetical protein